jgi:hypothetical protein
LTDSGYLQRLEGRRAEASLKKLVVFGLVLGWGSLLVGAMQLYLVPDSSEPLSRAAIGAGALLLSITLFAPRLLTPVERAWMAVASLIGKTLFGGVLAVTYLIAFAPVGLLLRARRGSHPVYEWYGSPPGATEGWIPKVVPSVDRGAAVRRPLIAQLVQVLFHLRSGGSWILLPTLVLLLVLGLVMFFVQTSSLAPFIYTVF